MRHVEPLGGRRLENATEQPTPNRRGRFYLYCRQNGVWPNEVAGHNPHTEPKWFDPYCPIRNVTAKYPPTFLIHGTEDTDVPYAESRNMAAKLVESGVTHEFITVTGAGHRLSVSGAEPDKAAQIARRQGEGARIARWQVCQASPHSNPLPEGEGETGRLDATWGCIMPGCAAVSGRSGWGGTAASCSWYLMWWRSRISRQAYQNAGT